MKKMSKVYANIAVRKLQINSPVNIQEDKWGEVG